jgi:hypothetical protein
LPVSQQLSNGNTATIQRLEPGESQSIRAAGNAWINGTRRPATLAVRVVKSQLSALPSHYFSIGVILMDETKTLERSRSA